jgi:SAM-dependent methyltransferase
MIDTVQAYIESLRSRRPLLRVLEAGCGSASHFDFGKYSLISGIDTSLKQLERNRALHERICGDLQDCDLPSNFYDVIVCWDVLEHVPKPELALSTFSSCIRKDGLIIIGAPNVWSFEGLLTKFTPYSFHAWLLHTVFGSASKEAVQEDHGPFPTFLRRSMSPGALKRYAESRQYQVAYAATYDRGRIELLRNKNWILYIIVKTIASLVWILTCGKIHPTRSSFILVLRTSAPHISQDQ